MTKETVAQKKLMGLIKKLSPIRGRHTELITIYVPTGTNFSTVSNQVAQEQGTAANIKSKTVRKNVLGALEKIAQHLKLYKTTPPNGLAIFCGNVSEKEGDSDIELWVVEPPEKLNQRLYRCDQTFVLDPLKHMVREKEVYGLIVLDKSDSEIATLTGKRIEPLKHIESLVPGKTKKGGWSQARYARVREGLLNDHLKKTGEIATAFFRELKDLRGVVIGGPGPIKDMFHNGDFLPSDLKSKVVGVVDTSYTGVPGLEEMLVRGEDILAEASVTRERKIMERFFSELAKDSGLAIYGIKETVEALEKGAVETLLISEDLDWVHAGLQCPSCRKALKKMVREDRKNDVKCPGCGTVMELKEENDAVEMLDGLAEQRGANVEMVSAHTREGEQLLEMGGVAGLLRYNL
ncbi:MAG: peptide chain release factor 1 [Candidatus Aenigmatarchaeota archaeon]|nr:MAG: peptide chain release factor 1 [Candidatus Aenigmarchaeota archaeon]